MSIRGSKITGFTLTRLIHIYIYIHIWLQNSLLIQQIRALVSDISRCVLTKSFHLRFLPSLYPPIGFLCTTMSGIDPPLFLTSDLRYRQFTSSLCFIELSVSKNEFIIDLLNFHKHFKSSVGVFDKCYVEMTSQLQDGGYWHCNTSFYDLGRPSEVGQGLGSLRSLVRLRLARVRWTRSTPLPRSTFQSKVGRMVKSRLSRVQWSLTWVSPVA